MPKGNGTKYCIALTFQNGVLKQGYRGLMAAAVVEGNIGNAAARLRAGGQVYLENRASNLAAVEKLLSQISK